MKVVITPHTSFVPGIVQRILGEIGCGPVLADIEGKIHAELNQMQLDLFKLKGAAHRVDIVTESETTPILDAPVAATFPETESEPAPLTITVETSPGVRQTMKVGPVGLEPLVEANQPVAGSQTPLQGSQTPVEGSQEKSA